MSDIAGTRFLDDVRVLEIATLAPTQLAMHLADLGAEVIKIEPPSRGDATRLVGRRPGFADSGIHRRWNRGKKSVAVDTSTPEGVDVLRRLIPQVDIVIEGMRRGALEKLGLDWSALTALKPNLVMVALSGYGRTGPYRDLPSHGVGFDAVAGLASVETDDRGRPRVASRHVYYGALVAPLLGATAALAALSWSRRTGRAVLLDIAQADAAAFANFAIEDAAGDGRRQPDAATGPSTRTTQQAYRTRDGKLLLVMALERKFFIRLAGALGRPDLASLAPEDEYLARGSEEIDEAMVDIIGSKDLDEWMDVFAAADVPAAPVNESTDAADDPQLRARTEWLEADQGTVTMKTPVRGEPGIASPRAAPAIGQDTAEVLAAIGIDGAELDGLARRGVIAIAPATRET